MENCIQVSYMGLITHQLSSPDGVYRMSVSKWGLWLLLYLRRVGAFNSWPKWGRGDMHYETFAWINMLDFSVHNQRTPCVLYDTSNLSTQNHCFRTHKQKRAGYRSWLNVAADIVELKINLVIANVDVVWCCCYHQAFSNQETDQSGFSENQQ